MDEQEAKELTKKKTAAPNIVSVGITWIDSRILFKPGSKWGKLWLGVCHYSDMIWAVSPLDYEYPTMITTIFVAPIDNYCERAYTCLYFKCPLNKFNKLSFLKEFKDCGKFTLGLPLDFGSKDLWFNEDSQKLVWQKFKIPITGGTLKFDENKAQ